MCFQQIALCRLCLNQVGLHSQACPPQVQQAPGHQVHNRPAAFIYPQFPYACSDINCIASTQLHWALRNQQQAAIQQGKANLNYVPFHTIKRWWNDTDEASDLALDHYPPECVQSAPRVAPDWLSRNQFRKLLEMRSRGKNVLEIAAAVGKNASLLRVYMDTYLKNVNTDSIGPLPSASSTETQSTATSTGSDELFPLGYEVMVPQQGAPDPSFLSRTEQELVWKLFQQNRTVRSMCERLGKKSRRKISQYINAYMRPKLLKLQTEEREAEERQSGILMYTTGLNDRITFPQTVPMTATAGTAPQLFQEPSIPSINEMDLEPLIDPLLTHTPNATHQREEPSPLTSGNKRKYDEVQAEPPRTSKRPRHHSFP